MANNSSGGNNGFLYFIVGALVVAVIGFGVVQFTDIGGPADDGADFSIQVDEDGIEVDSN